MARFDITLLTPDRYKTTRWSGGSTTQLLICPPEAQYADRDFLEEYAPLCGRGEEWACLLVRCAGDRNGILVVPERRYVEWAALVDTEA